MIIYPPIFCTILFQELHYTVHTLVKVEEAYSWMMFIVLELNQLLLVVDTQIIITVDTLRMQESGVLVIVILIVHHVSIMQSIIMITCKA